MKLEIIFNRESGEFKIATTFKSWGRNINMNSVLTEIENRISTCKRIPLGKAGFVFGIPYVAPDRYYMGVDDSGRIFLSKEEPEHNLRPSISYLFRSVNNAYGAYTIGVLLTGMGTDGAEELKLIKDNGGLTIAQDEESSVVHGMAGKTIKLDAADYILSPEKIEVVLKTLTVNYNDKSNQF